MLKPKSPAFELTSSAENNSIKWGDTQASTFL